MKICQRYFCSGDEPESFFSIVKQVVGKLGQGGGADKGFCPYHDRQVCFSVSVFSDVHIKHKVDKSPLEGGPQPFEHVKSGSGDTGSGFKVYYSQLFAYLPVGEGCKTKLAGGACGSYDYIVIFAFTLWYR